MKQNIDLSIYFHDFTELLFSSLTPLQGIELIKELDAYHGSWTFTHEIFAYVLSIINEDTWGYKRFLEDLEDTKSDEFAKLLDELAPKFKEMTGENIN